MNPVHADVAHPAGDRRRADLLPALPDEPRAEGAAADHRRQRLEVAEELPGVGGEPQGLPLPGELDRAGAARRQVAAVPGARAHDPAAGDQERQRRGGVLPTISRGSTRSRGSTCAACGSRSARLTAWCRGRRRARCGFRRRRARNGTTARTTSSRAPSTRRTSGTTGGSRAAAPGRPGRRSTPTSKAITSCRSSSTGACTCSGRCSAR